jgi:YcxB-like protein
MPLTAHFELTEEDYIAFNLYHHAHSAALRRRRFRAWLALFSAWIVASVLSWYVLAVVLEVENWWILVVPVFVLPLIFLIAYPSAYRRSVCSIVRSMIREGSNRGFLAPRTVTITSDRLKESSDFKDTSLAWRAVERVAHTSDHIFIYISAMSAIIVPRRAFASSSEFDDFLAAATRFHQQVAT